MYLVIIENNYKYEDFLVFSSKENIEEWFDQTYKYEIIPNYKLIEFDEIDPDIGKIPYKLYKTYDNYSS
jgi:hypothetical protein